MNGKRQERAREEIGTTTPSEITAACTVTKLIYTATKFFTYDGLYDEDTGLKPMI